MAGCIDTALRAQHVTSERWRPKPKKIVATLPRGLRAQLYIWMFQTFDVLGLDDALVHGIALTIDRFCASLDCALPQSSLECMLLAAACTEFKTDGFSDCADGAWKRILLHMSQGRVPLLEILRFECELLRRLGYVVGLPTPLSFLRSLGVRMRGEVQAPNWLGLASCLLELALLDPDAQHGSSHAILAAAALSSSLRAQEAPRRQRDELLEDVAMIADSGSSDVRRQILHCEEELLELWIRTAMGLGEFHNYFPKLEAKFRRQSSTGVALPSPAAALTSLREELENLDSHELYTCSAEMRGPWSDGSAFADFRTFLPVAS